MAERHRGSPEHVGAAHVAVELLELYRSDFEKPDPKNSLNSGSFGLAGSM